MILLTFLGSPNVRIEGTILLLGDRGECDLEGILRVTKWKVTLVVIVFLIHNSTPLDLLKSAGADLCPKRQKDGQRHSPPCWDETMSLAVMQLCGLLFIYGSG